MTPIADMIEKMVADGVPMATITLAVRTAEQVAATGKSGGIPVDTAAEKRRAYDRERKAKKRNSGGKSGGIPPETKNASSSLKGEIDKDLESKKRGRGVKLPVEWKPSEGHYAEGAKVRRTREQVDEKAEEMRLWARANGHRAVARKLDWDAAFSGWLNRDWGSSNGSKGPAHVAENRSLVAAARRAADRFSRAPELGDQPSESVLRLVSESGR
jgi:hypothetical protein